MNWETMFQLDPKIWPLAVMAFLRVATIMFWLPLFGDQGVPVRVRILLALVVTFFLWPSIEGSIRAEPVFLQWSPLTLGIATLREVFFGFCVAWSSRMLLHAATFGAHLVGVNMGFQTASLFSQATGHQESAFSALHGLLVLMLILILNIHHAFLEGIARSFATVPLAASADAVKLARVAIGVITECFSLAIRIGAPLLVVQLLVSLALACLAKAMPQLNVFILSFPLSFALSMIVIFVGAGTLIRFLATEGLHNQIAIYEQMLRVFPAKPIATEVPR